LIGAGEGIRTLDIHLGKVVLYQLSYARKPLTKANMSILFKLIRAVIFKKPFT
jgi:hypothetical protein